MVDSPKVRFVWADREFYKELVELLEPYSVDKEETPVDVVKRLISESDSEVFWLEGLANKYEDSASMRVEAVGSAYRFFAAKLRSHASELRKLK